MLSSRTEASNLINEIVLNYNAGCISDITQNCIKLTKHLFSHQYLLYTDLNDTMESSGIVKCLMKSLDRLDELSRRDVLRLIHLILHVNKSLREYARQNDEFQTFLRRYLDNVDNWNNTGKYKHHINIASMLMADREQTSCSFNMASVRKFVLRRIDSLIGSKPPNSEDMLPLVIFYACSMFTTTFEDIPTNNVDEPASEKILSKELTGRCLDIMREYVQDFKPFYETDGEADRSSYILYKAKSEFSFQQVCSTVIYYSVQSRQLRMNTFQSGLYIIMNNLFSIKDTPELLLHNGIDILKISILDDAILVGVKNELLKSISAKLNCQIRRPNLSERLKSSIRNILEFYDSTATPRSDDTNQSETNNKSMDIPTGVYVKPCFSRSKQLSISINNITQKPFIHSTSNNLEEWTQSDVRQWLTDNKLDDLREIFSYLTGGGLKQLQTLATQSDKIKFIEFMMSVMRIRFDMTLELISALEKL